MKRVRCAICGADRYEWLGRPRIEGPFRSVPAARESAIVRCTRCGFYYTQPMPFWCFEELQELCNSSYFPTMSAWWQQERTKHNPRRRLDSLERYARPRRFRRFLEVGCGHGDGMSEALQRGWEVHGQDVSAAFAHVVKQSLGIDIFLGFLEDAKYPDHYFDAIYVDSVLEHVPEPLRMLTELRRILNPDGVLQLTVTNEAALCNRVLNAVYKPLPVNRTAFLSPYSYPYHIVGFTETTLRRACTRAGLDVARLVIRAGAQEWRKVTLREAPVKTLITTMCAHPLYALGERTGQGIAIEAPTPPTYLKRPLSKRSGSMKVALLLIGDINALTGGYLYERTVVAYLRSKGVRIDVIRLPAVPFPYFLHLFSDLLLVARFFRKEYDIVVADQMAHPALFLFNFWLSYVKRAKIVVIVHFLWWKATTGFWRRRYVQFVETVTLKRAHLIIANSQYTKNELVEKMGIPGTTVRVVYPGFDLPRAAHSDRAPTRTTTSIKLLSVANVNPCKGLDTLITALHRLNDPTISLDVVGDTRQDRAYGTKLKERIKRWRLDDRVRFHGVQAPQKLGRYYADADIFVLPSRYESFGIVVAEAMAFGLPIIASRVGGIPELVTDGDNGLLVPAQNAEALADAIQKLASDPELRERLGWASREKTLTLNTWDDCGEHLFRLLTAIGAKSSR